jgi:hypothetical protein
MDKLSIKRVYSGDGEKELNSPPPLRRLL